MGKAKRAKKERRLAKEKGIDVQAGQKESTAKRKGLLYGIPALGVLGAAVAKFVLESDPILGLSLTIGAGGWIVVYLSEIGKEIPPKDSSASAAIEFGRTR